MFKKIAKQIEANRHSDEQMRELAFLLGGLAYIECKDAVITINEERVEVAIFEKIDGTRVRRAVGESDNLADAIKNVADIIDRQDGVESH
jgi:hypothetical protein